MLELFNIPFFALKYVEDVFMLHQLFFYVVLGVTTVTDFDACNYTLVVDFGQFYGYGIATIDE